MTLSEYLKREGAESLTDLSAKLGISKGRLSQLRNEPEWPPELALRAETATGGLLNAAALSPIIAQARKTAA